MIVGRAVELQVVDDFLAGLDIGPAALTLDGDPGIGKTTLWTHGLETAAGRDFRVLSARPTECETELAYAGLGDLLAQVPDSALARLPDPQRRALEVALLRREPEEQQPLPRGVALALLSVLGDLSGDQPVLVAVDDMQWLDHPSESALGFVVRRLTDERVGLLVSRRAGQPDTGPLDLPRALPHDRQRHIHVEPLEPNELGRLLSAQLGMGFPRRVVESLHRMSGGNPFYAVEIARAMASRADLRGPDELPIPATLQGLVSDRLAALPEPARRATQFAAALSRPTVALVDAAMANDPGAGSDTGSTRSPLPVEDAVAAGVLESDGDRIRFTHPLLASVTYAQLPPSQRRVLHASLSEVVVDVEERARHLAAAADQPDAATAAALDEAARRAHARGAPDSAADLWEQARRLTPVDDRAGRRHRGIEAAARHFDAGDVEQAAVVLDEVVAETPPGRDRARALARLGWVRAHRDGFHAGEAVFRDALAEHSDDPALRIEIEQGLAWCLHETSGLPAAEDSARTALELAERLGDPALLATALSHYAFLTSLSGKGIALPMIERAVGLGQPPPWSQILGRPDWIHALLLQWCGDLATSHQMVSTLYRAAVDRGDDHALPFALFDLARIELLIGDWQPALAHAQACHETTLQSRQVGEAAYSFMIMAMVEAHLGLVEDSREHIEAGLAIAQDLGTEPAALEALAALGFLELSLGNAAEADRALEQVRRGVERTGLHEPALFRFHGDAIEAKVMLGRYDEAADLLDRLHEFGATLGRPWVLAVAARSGALLSAATGELTTAYQQLEDALALHEEVAEPFERARTLLVRGSIARRNRQKRVARESLVAARDIFESLGATLWVAKADAELARIGGRAPAAGLTPTEARVAELIASGRSYQETADALFISPKTVQWNLSKIYRKLGVRSATELAARLAPAARHKDDTDSD